MLTRDTYLAFGRPDFGEEELAAVASAFQSGWVGMGAETIAFEDELARFVGASEVVTVNSCTSALFLSLAVLGVGPGDEVICPSLTWCATANVALHLGATPVFCDVDRHTLCATTESILSRVTPRTKVVIPVHFGGRACDVAGLRAALPPHVHIVEDAAHAIGARYAEGGPVGSSGNLVCFSFYANKNLSTAEGGAIALFDPKVAERLRSLRQNAMPADAWKRFTHASTIIAVGPSEIGYKLNYTDLQACIGRVQLRRQEVFAARRIEIARIYMDRLRDALGADGFQEGLDAESHARHLFVVKVPIEKSGSRDAILGRLRERNIGATVHYMPLHQMPFYRVPQLSLGETEWLASRLLTLPIGSAMTTADAEYVCGHLLELLGHD